MYVYHSVSCQYSPLRDIIGSWRDTFFRKTQNGSSIVWGRCLVLGSIGSIDDIRI